jgi:hypothetical protein
MTQPDALTARIKLNIPYRYGLCEVIMLTYNGNPLEEPLSRIGKCFSNFDFHAEGSVTLSSGDMAGFTYSFFPEGNLHSGSPLKPAGLRYISFPSSPTGCESTLLIEENPLGTFTFSLSNTPSGTCKLSLGSVDVDWPGCAPISLTYYDMGQSQTPGNSINVGYKYFGDPSSGATETCASTSTSSITPYILYPFALVGVYKESITLGLGVPFGDYFNSLTIDARVDFLGVGGTSVEKSISVSPATPSSTFTAINGVDGVGITPGQPYFAELLVMDSTSVILGRSGIVPILTADPPMFPSDPSSVPPTVMVNGTNCVVVSWTVLTDPVNAPIDCYEVGQTHKSSSLATPSDLEILGRPCGTSFGSCDLNPLLLYQYTIKAINKQQLLFTSVPLSSFTNTVWFSVSDLLADPTNVYSTTVDPLSNTYIAGTFPTFSINSVSDASGTMKIFVGMLVNKGSLDANSRTIVEYELLTGTAKLVGPLTDTDPAPFVVTYSYSPRSSSTYYDLVVGPAVVTTAGTYSLVTFAVQSGGLRGQYWANPDLLGQPDLDRQDRVLDMDWGSGKPIFFMPPPSNKPVYDQTSIRWTGFIEAEFSELYTFHIETTGYLKMWIDNILIINRWEDVGPCLGVCIGQYELVESIPLVSNTNSRKFHYLQIEVRQLVRVRSGPFAIKLRWSSLSREDEIIPQSRLFAGYPIEGYPVSGIGTAFDLPTINIQAGSISLTRSSVTATTTQASTGEAFRVYLTLMDAYGNIVTGSSVVIEMVLQPDTGGSSTTYQALPVSSSPGKFFVEFTLTNPGNFLITPQNSLTLEQYATVAVTVVPTVVGSIVINVPSTLTTGTLFSLTFDFKDPNANTITTDTSFDRFGSG